MTEATVKAVAKRVPIIVMVGATSLENAVELAKHAHAAGADANGLAKVTFQWKGLGYYRTL